LSIYGPDQRRTSRTHTRQPQPDERPEYLACSVCGFPVLFDTVPSGSPFPTTFTVTGNTYVWDSADDALSTLDKTVEPVPQGGTCGFCGATDFLGGTRGTQ